MENCTEAFLRLKSSFLVIKKMSCVLLLTSRTIKVFMYVLFNRDCLKDDLSCPVLPVTLNLRTTADTGIFLNQRSLRSTKVLSLYM